MRMNYNLRPCMVATRKGGKEEKALFHCWEQWSNTVAPSILKGGSPGGQVSEIYGIVEFEDGTIKSVSPSLIRFLDNPFNDYAWEKGGGNDSQANPMKAVKTTSLPVKST